MKKYNTEGTLIDFHSYVKSLPPEPKTNLKFIRILGCSGSGKSEFVRQMHIQDPDWFFLVQEHPTKKDSIERLLTVFPSFNVAVVGCYIRFSQLSKFYKEDLPMRSIDWYDNEIFVTSGGADSLKDNPMKLDRIAKGWQLPYDLYIEGSIIASQDYIVTDATDANNKLGKNQRIFIDALVQPSLEVALARIEARGKKMYKDDTNTRAKHMWFSNKISRLAKEGRRTVIIDSGTYTRQATIKNILGTINKIK